MGTLATIKTSSTTAIINMAIKRIDMICGFQKMSRHYRYKAAWVNSVFNP
jgi:hypothetical protein